MRLSTLGDGDAKAHLRPTSDRVRENLFNALGSLYDLSERRVLDLFAGTGALGLESLSRGASHCTFVENGHTAQKLIQQNIAITKTAPCATLIRADARALPRNTDAEFDLIFIDPPYGQNMGEQALHSAQKQGWLTADAWVVWEENAPKSMNGFTIMRQKRYGKTYVSILQAMS